jgi:hypothetical protein
MTWTSVLYVFIGLFLLLFVGFVWFVLNHMSYGLGIQGDVLAVIAKSIADPTGKEVLCMISFWSAVYALCFVLPITGLYAFAVLVVKLIVR